MDENDQRRVIEYTARLASLVAQNALEMSGKTVQFIVTKPFEVSDLEGLLPSDATVVIDGPVDEPDIVVLGTHDFDEDEITAAVDARHDETSFLPQDGFLDLVLFGYDWWAHNVNLLNRSRDTHPGMSYLHSLRSLQSFNWPGTDATESTGTTDSEGDFNSETPFHKLGYNVSEPTSKSARWLILSQVAVPTLGLEEVVQTIANHIRLRKTQVGGAEKYRRAIGEWEHDLARLKSTYYQGSNANSHWPSTGS
jgi:hypothetical protein